MYARTKRATRTGLALLATGAATAATLLSAPPAQALVRYASVHVFVSWTGPVDCITVHGPAVGNPYVVSTPTRQCSPGAQWATWDYVAASGQVIGIDPEMSGATSLFCSTSVNGDLVYMDSADRGDGTEATCLGVLA